MEHELIGLKSAATPEVYLGWCHVYPILSGYCLTKKRVVLEIPVDERKTNDAGREGHEMLILRTDCNGGTLVWGAFRFDGVSYNCHRNHL